MNKPTPLKVSAPVRSRPKTSLDKTQSRGEKRRTAGVGLHTSFGASFRTALTSELYGVLDRAAGDCTETRNGRCWPRPRKEVIRSLVEQFDAEVCRRAAKEAREIVHSQDRAPNITSLFAKKCADIDAERQSIRDEIRRALA
jgi:hypothetical protein